LRKLLNTLYVTSQGAYLARDGETVKVSVEKETRLRVPIHTLGGIVCFGRVGASPALMGLCGERGVPISFLTENGRFLARVTGPVSGNVLLRRKQYRDADDGEAAAGIARAVVTAKLANGRTVLLRGARDGGDLEAVERLGRAAEQTERLLRGLDGPADVEGLRAVEGEAGRIYFGVFNDLIVAQKEDFEFHVRSRRPPLDRINALLSFVYTLVSGDVIAALESVGLDPQVGFLHRERPGRPSLALDLMEELRAFLADRLVLSLVNRQQVKGSGFRRTESGAVLMDDKTRKEVLVAYQKRKQEELRHPFLGEKIAIGLVAHVQALLLARHLRGDLEGYAPFLWR